MATTDTAYAIVPVQLTCLECQQDSAQHGLPNIRVLIVDDNIDSAHKLGVNLRRHGYRYETSPSVDVAIDFTRHLACDVVICNAEMPGISELELLELLLKVRPDLPVVVVAVSASMSTALSAARRRAFHWTQRPFDMSDLLGAIAKATEGFGLSPSSMHPPRHATGSQSEFEQASSAMRDLAASIALVAKSNAPVLILGESGTGKECVARAIHAKSPRAEQAFVAFNPATIPERLLGSELFGHVPGAFTGAVASRPGLLCEAHRGTLLLEDIGDMPIGIQAKLLRVLQFGETRALGSDQITHVDIRVVATSQLNLALLANDGRLRKDLLYRLNTITLLVPPLRERRDDIPALAKQFLEEARERNPHSPVSAISDAAMSALILAPWPGNVRELQNAIERLVVLCRSTEVSLSDLALLNPEPQKRRRFLGLGD